MCGMSDTLIHRKAQNIDSTPELVNQFCYILEGNDDNGFLMVLYKKDGTIGIKFTEYDGTVIDVLTHTSASYISSLFSKKLIDKFIEFINYAKIDILQICFVIIDDNLFILEAATHINKYLSPGMIKDVLTKCGVPSLPLHSIQVLSPDLVSSLRSGKYIVYTSYPSLLTRDDNVYLASAKL